MPAAFFCCGGESNVPLIRVGLNFARAIDFYFCRCAMFLISQQVRSRMRRIFVRWSFSISIVAIGLTVAISLAQQKPDSSMGDMPGMDMGGNGMGDMHDMGDMGPSM